MKKRILSLIIAIVMVASMLPAGVIFAGAEESATLNYVFDNLYNSLPGDTVLSTITSYNQTAGSGWKYNSGSPNSPNSLMKNNRLEGDTRAVGQYIALDINVPNDGAYMVSYTYFAFNGRGSKGDVYILPEGTSLANIETAKAAGTKIASVDYSTDGTSVKTQATCLVDTVTLTKGNNILLFVVTDKGAKAVQNAARDYFTYPYSLALTPLAATPPTEPAGVTSVFDFKSNKTLANGEEKFIASGKSPEEAFPASDTDGWSAYCYSAGAEYIQVNDSTNRTISQIGGESLKLSINTVGDWVALRIPVLKRGIYDASLTYKMFQHYASADIYMIEAPKEELSENERRAYIAEALMTAPKCASIDCNNADEFQTPVAAPSAVEFTFSAYEDNCDYLMVVKSTSSLATKKKILLDTLTLDGSGTKESSLPEFVYNFNTKSGIAGNSNPLDAKYSDTLSMWEGYTSSGISTAQAKSSQSNLAFFNVGDFVAFKINLPASDTFIATISYYKHASYGDDGDVYLLPGSTKKEDVVTSLTADKKLASLSYYVKGEEAAGIYVSDKIEKTLSAGEYIVVFNGTAASADKTDGNRIRIYPGNITLTRKTEEPPYTLVAENAKLVPGEVTTLSLKDFDGNPIDEFTVSAIASSDESIAAADGKTVTAGNSFGRVKLTATVEVSGETLSAEGYVRVINKAPSETRITANIDTREASWINPGYERDPSLYRSKDIGINDIGGFEPGDGITSEYTDGWSWYGDNAKDHGDNAFAQNNKQSLTIRMADGEWFAIKMNFANAGHYRALVNHRSCATNAYADMYFIPVPKMGESVSDYLTDEYKLGRIENNNPDVAKWNSPGAEVSSYVGDAYVDAPGEYLAVIQMTGRTATGKQYLTFNDLVFSGTSPISAVGGSSSEAVMIGDTITLDKSMLTFEAPIPEYSEKTTLKFESLTPDVITVTQDGVVTGISNGVGKVKVTATYEEHILSGEFTVVVGSGKTRRSYYTDEKVKNAKKNIERYSWAKSEANAYIREADKLLEVGADTLYGLITTQELPRASTLAFRFRDTGAYQCIYCDKDLTADYGTYPWVMNVYNRPWKIQCPDCKRVFPSNDFESFYKLGFDENGNWRYELALQRHHEKFVCADGELCECEKPQGERKSDEWIEYYGYGKGYLKNDSYGEVGRTLGVAADEVDRWAVDDGWGYEYTYQLKNEDGTPATNEDGTPKTENRCKPFIAYYNAWGLWEAAIPSAIEDLGMAYLYTGDIRYGRLGAIMLDRVADVYPDFDATETGSIFQLSDGNTLTESGGTSRGRILGRLHDCNISQVMVPAYDALWPAYKDEWVIDYLSKKAVEMNLRNPKTSAGSITANIENNYLREINSSIHDYRISANFGVTEKLHITAAVVLDTLPETEEWIKFVFQSGKQSGYSVVTGGNVYAQLINVVDRDGHGNEAAPGYNSGWINNMLLIGEALDGYDKVTGYDLYNNPKMKRMLMSEIDILCASVWSPLVGDDTFMGNRNMAPLPGSLISAYRILDDEETRNIIVKTLYHRMRRSFDSIHGSIFEADPEDITRATKAAISDDLEIPLPSRDLTGYGIAILRDGDWLDSTDTSNNINTQRDFYIWYGQTNGHGHRDKLNLGFHAFGLDVGADLGVPRLKNSTDPQRFELVEHTMAHNTVMVNNLQQKVNLDSNPLHFDSTDRVQLMDVEAPEIYDWQGVEEYRRTLVMVDVDDDISYGVDFFRILGGDDHLYSFHALAREADVSENVVIKKQTDASGKYVGSYQGIDKPWGGSNINSIDISNQYGGQFGLYDIDRDLGGTTDGLGAESWFGEVDRAENPSEVESFSVDWKIVDNGKALNPPKNDLHVRLTMVPSFKVDEITTSSVLPPQLEGAMDKARYLFVRHTGEADGNQGSGKLETLFTSVIEPYDTTRYVESIENATVKRADGAALKTDEAKAVKVKLINGREDYIVYAKDNTVSYEVSISDSDSFAFCGFVGVVSIKDGKVVYTYVNDGSAIADKENLLPAYTGKVTGFEGEISEENYIDVALNEALEDPSVFENRYIYVENGLTDNASYLIESAEKTADGVRLNIGDTTLITSYIDDNDFSKGYNYNIKKGNSFTIPMSYVDDNAPEFDAVSNNLTTTAESSISVTVRAQSPLDENVYYSAARLPRGASFDEATGMLTWKPTSSQIGKNIVSIDAKDDSGRESRITFEITVYGSTTGGTTTPTEPTTPSEPTTPTTPTIPGSSGASSGGGGGGGGAAPTIPSEPNDDQTDDGLPLEGKVPSEGEADEVENTDKRFIDLGAHAWASDAINSLAEAGIIKGTSENTFSPANNITRADFAILLVRAFGLTSDNTENFADVNASDYFAAELAIARNNGIIGGIGDNKFAPKNSITRQDMMVIVYRALTANPVGEGLRALPSTDEVLSKYPDFNSVAPYAQDAVSSLIGAGLVNGKSGKIAPQDFTTRAEVAVLIKRILDYIAK